MSLEDIVRHSSGPIFNNAGQILNHNLYFTQFRSAKVISGEGPSAVISSEGEAGVEKSTLVAQIIKQWGSLDAFKADFVQKGTSLFGSGWVWLQADASSALTIGQYSGADNPSPTASVPSLLSTSGNTHTTSTTRTVALLTWRLYGRLSIGEWQKRGLLIRE